MAVRPGESRGRTQVGSERRSYNRPMGGFRLDLRLLRCIRAIVDHERSEVGRRRCSVWTGPRPPSRREAGLLTAALLFAAAVWTLGLVGMSAAEGLLGWDVRFAYLPAADAVLDGRSPYPELDDPILLDQKGYVYPPQLLYLVLPLTPLPDAVVGALVAACLIALVVLTLRVLGVTDLRCYAAAFLWMPTTSGRALANVSIPLASRPRSSGATGTRSGRRRSRSGSRSRRSSSSGPSSMDGRHAAAPGDRVGDRDRRRRDARRLGGDRVRRAGGLPGPSCAGCPRSSPRTATPSSALRTPWGCRSGSARRRCCSSGRSAPRVLRRLRAPRRRLPLVHGGARRHARAEPDRVAPLPRGAARADGDRPAALLGALAPPRCSCGRARSRGMRRASRPSRPRSSPQSCSSSCSPGRARARSGPSPPRRERGRSRSPESRRARSLGAPRRLARVDRALRRAAGAHDDRTLRDDDPGRPHRYGPAPVRRRRGGDPRRREPIPARQRGPLTQWGGPYPYPPLPALAAIPLTVLPFDAAGVLVMAALVAAALATLRVLDVTRLALLRPRAALALGPVRGADGQRHALVRACRCARLALPGPTATRVGERRAHAGHEVLPGHSSCGSRRRGVSRARVVSCVVGAALLLPRGPSSGSLAPSTTRTSSAGSRRRWARTRTRCTSSGGPGASLGDGSRLWLLLGLGLLAAVVVRGRRGDERSAFLLALAASIALTPIVWLHYFALLLVVVALAQPRLGFVWFVPLAMVITPGSGHPSPFETAATLAIAALTIALALRRPAEEVGLERAGRIGSFASRPLARATSEG